MALHKSTLIRNLKLLWHHAHCWEWYETARLCNGTRFCTLSSHRLEHNKLFRCCTIAIESRCDWHQGYDQSYLFMMRGSLVTLSCWMTAEGDIPCLSCDCGLLGTFFPGTSLLAWLPRALRHFGSWDVISCCTAPTLKRECKICNYQYQIV